MKPLPFVSIVILTYNGEGFISNLLRSLCQQNYESDKLEILVVDNDSSDRTCAIVKSDFPEISLIQLGQNHGFARGNNLALSHVTHDFVAFLNQDTICHRDWLKGLINGLMLDESIGACASNMVMCDPSADCDTMGSVDSRQVQYYDINSWGYGIYCQTSADYVFPTIISGCSFLIHKKRIAALGYLFDEDLKMYTEDTDLSLRILNQGLKVCVARDSVVFHLHGANPNIDVFKVKTAIRAIRNRVLVYYKNLPFVDFIFYLPFLLAGGPMKIWHLPISTDRKLYFLLPFSIFSIGSMVTAFLEFPFFWSKRRLILKKSKLGRGKLLRLILKNSKVFS